MPSIAMTIAEQDLPRVREALVGPTGSAVIDWMHRLNLRMPLAHVTDDVKALTRDLGWTDAAGRHTPLGFEVSASLREYTFWVERGRTTHGARRHEALADACYSGKAVLEVGSGFGANLLSLSGVASRLVGLEPVAVYRQLSPILAEREGLPPIELVDGLGERMPFSGECFDVVMCYSSHQYMDARRAFAEMARVLRPGGQLQLMSGVLDQFMRVMLQEPSVSHLKHLVEVTTNTLAYQATGSRWLKRASLGTMNAPIYPTASHLRRWLTQAGLVFRDDLLRRDGSDTIVFADKPAAP